MTIEVKEKLIVTDPTPDIIKWVRKNLILDNPDFYKKQALGKWTGGISKEIYLYERSGNELWLPFGCLRDIWKIHPYEWDWRVSIKRDWLRAIDYKSDIKLYDYQQKAAEVMLERQNGILVMPCGSGKTQTGLSIIAEIGGRALWLTHTQDLLRQSMARAKSVYGIDKKTFGTITAGKVNIGESITFATVQTMSKLDLSQYRDQWDVIIVDECQHCAGTPTKVSQFYKVMSNLCARHKYGLTATPYRADGLEPAMYALLGDIGFEVSQDEVTSTVPVRVGYVNTGYMPEYSNILQGDGTIDYNKLLEDLITNDKRFDVVSKTIQEKQGKGACMVLANRVAYLERLNSQYSGRSICLSGKGQSKKAKKERAEALEKLNNGQLDCIFATYQLAAEGLDVPNLRYVFFATPEKNQTTVQQSAGRVSRGAEGKEYGTIIDFIDELPMYRAWANKRAAIYKKLS